MVDNIIVLIDKTFDTTTKNGNWVIDFYADWCNPCKIMAPHFEKAASEIKGVKFSKLDIEASPEVPQRFGVMSIPTTLFMQNGEAVAMHSGILKLDDIKKKISQNF